MLGVRPASPLNRQQFTQELDKMDPAGLPLNGELVKAIATCHSLTRCPIVFFKNFTHRSSESKAS